jgi:polar amino acid transport system substrate-binding protein
VVEKVSGPGKRRLTPTHAATAGGKDGEIMRIWTYGKENPTTLRAPTPCYQLETMPFYKKGRGVVINNKTDLIK